MTRKPKRIRLPLHAYLLYLLTAALLCTGVTMANYVSGSYGYDSARVAKFVVEVGAPNVTAHTFNDLGSVAGNSSAESAYQKQISSTFTVKNVNASSAVSEVATVYDMTITWNTALPRGVKWTVQKNGTALLTAPTTDSTHTFSSVGTWSAAVSATDTYTLIIYADERYVTDFSNVTANISVTATQID